MVPLPRAEPVPGPAAPDLCTFAHSSVLWTWLGLTQGQVGALHTGWELQSLIYLLTSLLIPRVLSCFGSDRGGTEWWAIESAWCKFRLEPSCLENNLGKEILQQERESRVCEA